MLSAFISLLEDEEDRELFAQIYHQYQRELYAVAMRYLRDAPLAEDAVQDAFVKVIENFSKFKAIPCKEREFWIVCIVKNLAHDTLRRQQRRSDEEPEPVFAEEIDEHMNYQELVAKIRALPEVYREALELKTVLEWSNQAIAEKLGISETAVGARVSRGRRLLRRRLAE